MYHTYYIYVYANLPRKIMVVQPHPRSRDSQGHEPFLVPPADKETRNYDTHKHTHTHTHTQIYMWRESFRRCTDSVKD